MKVLQIVLVILVVLVGIVILFGCYKMMRWVGHLPAYDAVSKKLSRSTATDKRGYPQEHKGDDLD
jgi:hypothetical protein